MYTSADFWPFRLCWKQFSAPVLFSPIQRFLLEFMNHHRSQRYRPPCPSWLIIVNWIIICSTILLCYFHFSTAQRDRSKFELGNVIGKLSLKLFILSTTSMTMQQSHCVIRCLYTLRWQPLSSVGEGEKSSLLNQRHSTQWNNTS